jgi:hypothetical protein
MHIPIIIVILIACLLISSLFFFLENGTTPKKTNDQKNIAISALPPPSKEIDRTYSSFSRKTPNYALHDSSGNPSLSPDFKKDALKEMVKIQEAMVNIASSSLIEEMSPIKQRDMRLKHFFGTYFGAGTVSWMVALLHYTNVSTKKEMEQIRSDLISWRTDYNFHQCPALYSLGCLYKPAGDEQYWISELVACLYDAINSEEQHPSQIDLFSAD